ncbi:MAG: glycine cleavage system aminomethyltransferase GcvT [Actinocatenispora sp.]
MTDDLLESPLHDRHEALGAKFAAFGGWQMPLEYAGGGVIAEHTAVRSGVGLFDVSHLGKATVRGEGAAQFVNRCLANDLDRIGAGAAQYTLCCDDETGGVVDDLIAYRYSDDMVFLIPNASNTAEVCRRLSAAAPDGITVTNQHRDFAILAVQGPLSGDLLARLGAPSRHGYMSFEEGTVGGRPIVVCRTGYTGEHGYELVVAAEYAPKVWDALLEEGADLAIRPCGLAARDTLRTEMGYPLHGQDLSMSISPVQARASWAVGWKKSEFWGRERLLAEKEAGPGRRLWGLSSTGRGIPRHGMTVHSGADQVGEVTSGTFSPTLKHGIGLALLDTASGLSEGDEVEVDVRGRRSPMTVVKPPFVSPSVK